MCVCVQNFVTVLRLLLCSSGLKITCLLNEPSITVAKFWSDQTFRNFTSSSINGILTPFYFSPKISLLFKKNWDVSGLGRALQAVCFRVPVTVTAVPKQIGLYNATQNL